MQARGRLEVFCLVSLGGRGVKVVIGIGVNDAATDGIVQRPYYVELDCYHPAIVRPTLNYFIAMYM